MINNNIPTDFDTTEIRLKKLIELFEPLYNTSQSVMIKNTYKEHLTDLRNELEEIQNGNRRKGNIRDDRH